MTREEAIAHGKEQVEVFGGEHAEFIKLAIKALDQEPCEDAISRQSMLDYLKYLHGEMPEEEFIKELPSVTPARKTGHWIDTDVTILNRQGYLVHEVICSECDGISYFRSMGNKYIGANYCPNCGAKMDEDKL